MMDRMHPSLTTFALPKHRIGVGAAEILRAWIEGTLRLTQQLCICRARWSFASQRDLRPLPNLSLFASTPK